MIYGGPVILSGKVPVAKAGEKVTLRAEVLTPHRHEADELGRRGRARPSSGAFTFTTAPTAQTTYTVVWQATPAPRRARARSRCKVAPRIGVGIVKKVGRYVTFSTKATVGDPVRRQVGCTSSGATRSASGSR